MTIGLSHLETNISRFYRFQFCHETIFDNISFFSHWSIISCRGRILWEKSTNKSNDMSLKRNVMKKLVKKRIFSKKFLIMCFLCSIFGEKPNFHLNFHGYKQILGIHFSYSQFIYTQKNVNYETEPDCSWCKLVKAIAVQY